MNVKALPIVAILIVACAATSGYGAGGEDGDYDGSEFLYRLSHNGSAYIYLDVDNHLVLIKRTRFFVDQKSYINYLTTNFGRGTDPKSLTYKYRVAADGSMYTYVASGKVLLLISRTRTVFVDDRFYTEYLPTNDEVD